MINYVVLPKLNTTWKKISTNGSFVSWRCRVLVKTEVALRAAFKAVSNNKQVAFLVPTTILAQQHYETIQERFEGFPVEIGFIKSFPHEKQQK